MKKQITRKIAILICLSLAMTLMPIRVDAADFSLVAKNLVYVNPLYEDVITEEDLTSGSGISIITDEDDYAVNYQEVVSEIREAMTERQEMITVYFKTTEDYSECAYNFMTEALSHTGVPDEGDYLKWQYAGWKCSIRGFSLYGVYYLTFTYTVTYYTTAEQEAEMDAAVKELLNEMEIEDISDDQKLYEIYDHICTNVAYDYTNLNNSSYKLKYTAYGALIDGTAVCQGYAVLLYRLALEMGVDCRLISGTSSDQSHAWNIALVDGLYYNLDPTWDAGCETYAYFLKGSGYFDNHTRSSDYDTTEFHAAYPMSVKNYGKIDAPTVQAANVAASGKIRLTWDAVEGASSYKVYRSKTKTGTYSLMMTVSSTSYTNTSVVAGTTYYYYVTAIAADGTASEKSNIAVRTCDLPQPVITLSNVTASGKVKVTWDAVDNAVSYKVYRSTSKNGSYSLMLTTTSTSYTNTSAVSGKTYYYKVKAIASQSAANSAFSEIKSRTCDLPQPVVTVSNVAASGKIKVTWDAIDGASGYKVYRSKTKTGTYSLMLTTTSTSYTNTSAEAGETYYYKVMAISTVSAANSAYSEVKSRTCDLPRPVISVALTSAGKPQITWDAIDGAVSYKVYRSTSKDGAYTLLKTVTGTKLNNTSAVSGTTYYYKVMAVHSVSTANSAYSTVKYIKSS